ncbi:MAG: bifunctional transaldolase/phosoglucose isomerase [Methylococcaceae bacterium]
MNNLIDLLNYGQSYWLDNLTREKITSGEIENRVTQQGLRGITSNPSIFNKAMAEGDSYDQQINELVRQGNGSSRIYEILTVKDVQDACDILKPVYEQSGGIDGFVSLEVSPYLARNTKGTIDEVHRLFEEVNRSNCYIKIPGTKEGIPAIEQMLYEGIPINITLLFSVERYVEVAKAYIRALQRRDAEGKPVNNVVSVASFFLSRLDVLTDQLLGYHIIPEAGQRMENHLLPASLIGKTGIASARLAYQRFIELFSSKEWKLLEGKGAHVQRPLWASTGNKDPLFEDLRYVESLIGPDTVNTLPDETIDALARDGKLRENTIAEGLGEARQLFGQLMSFDINIEFVTQQLENEGIQKFKEAYNTLIGNLAKKRADMLGAQNPKMQISAGSLKKELEAAYASLDEKQAGRRLFAKDPYLWKTDPDQVKTIINGLGWITLPDSFMNKTKELDSFAKDLKNEGYEYAVLLGMGGSSLCSEVARETFDTARGYLQLIVLDNTDPQAIHKVEEQINIEKTLFIVASKSGKTLETLSFFKYFFDRMKTMNESEPWKHFVAITDEGTPLVKMAEEYQFRKVFINPSDVGGRYSVLTYFGLLPMALMGIDIKALLMNARQMEESCDPFIPAAINPAIGLGCLLGMAQRSGRDKVTFAVSSSIENFGLWVEQLLAESTGKEGLGIVPVQGESLGDPQVYGNDRVFVHLYLTSDNNASYEQKLSALEKAGHPVVRIGIPDKLALGGEYYRWEIATAIAGRIIGINPFDQPNVAESKKNTDQLLNDWIQSRTFDQPSQALVTEPITVYPGAKAALLLNQQDQSVSSFVHEFTSKAQPGDYIALLPYFLPTEENTKLLETWRQEMRDEYKVATTLLEGPRYLHSTGQLHKGGPDTGIFLIMMKEENEELPIPGEEYGFSILHQAQALGDFKSLNEKGRRVIMLQLGRNVEQGINEIMEFTLGSKHPI